MKLPIWRQKRKKSSKRLRMIKTFGVFSTGAVVAGAVAPTLFSTPKVTIVDLHNTRSALNYVVDIDPRTSNIVEDSLVVILLAKEEKYQQPATLGHNQNVFPDLVFGREYTFLVEGNIGFGRQTLAETRYRLTPTLRSGFTNVDYHDGMLNAEFYVADFDHSLSSDLVTVGISGAGITPIKYDFTLFQAGDRYEENNAMFDLFLGPDVATAELLLTIEGEIDGNKQEIAKYEYEYTYKPHAFIEAMPEGNALRVIGRIFDENKVVTSGTFTFKLRDGDGKLIETREVEALDQGQQQDGIFVETMFTNLAFQPYKIELFGYVNKRLTSLTYSEITLSRDPVVTFSITSKQGAISISADIADPANVITSADFTLIVYDPNNAELLNNVITSNETNPYRINVDAYLQTYGMYRIEIKGYVDNVLTKIGEKTHDYFEMPSATVEISPSDTALNLYVSVTDMGNNITASDFTLSVLNNDTGQQLYSNVVNMTRNGEQYSQMVTTNAIEPQRLRIELYGYVKTIYTELYTTSYTHAPNLTPTFTFTQQGKKTIVDIAIAGEFGLFEGITAIVSASEPTTYIEETAPLAASIRVEFNNLTEAVGKQFSLNVDYGEGYRHMIGSASFDVAYDNYLALVSVTHEFIANPNIPGEPNARNLRATFYVEGHIINNDYVRVDFEYSNGGADARTAATIVSFTNFNGSGQFVAEEYLVEPYDKVDLVIVYAEPGTTEVRVLVIPIIQP